MMKAVTLRIPPELLERVEALRADIEEVIQGRVADMKAGAHGVPTDVIRQDLVRHEHCRCAILRRWVEEAEALKVKAQQAAAEAETGEKV